MTFYHIILLFEDSNQKKSCAQLNMFNPGKPAKKYVVIFWLNWWKKPLKTIKFHVKDKFGYEFLQIHFFVKTTLISCSANKWQSSAKLWAAYRICSPLQSMIKMVKRLNNSSQSLIWLCCNWKYWLFRHWISTWGLVLRH